MRWSWLSLVLVACGDASSPPSDPPITFNPQARGDGGVPDAGCAADLASDPSHCGACDVACPQGDHQEASCLAGKCVAACESGFDDCDGNAANGCEKPVADDAENCGACGRSCAACGEAVCAEGACKVKELATGQTGAHDVSLDATRVYWTNRATGGGVRRASKTDGSTLQSVVTADNAREVIVSGSYIYWTQDSPDGVKRTPKPELFGPFPTFLTGQDFPGGLANDRDAIYWTRNVGLGGAIVRCQGCNTGALDIATNLPSAGRIAVDESSIVAVLGDAVVAYDKTGQNKTNLALGQKGILSITSDGTNVYFTDSKLVTRVPKLGGMPATFVNEPVVFVRYLNEHLYYAAADSLARIDADGTHRVDLAKGLTHPDGMITDDTCVYFVDGTRIARVTK